MGRYYPPRPVRDDRDMPHGRRAAPYNNAPTTPYGMAYPQPPRMDAPMPARSRFSPHRASDAPSGGRMPYPPEPARSVDINSYSPPRDSGNIKPHESSATGRKNILRGII
ncbi:MAG: hypothetical protein IJP17_06170, partial [Clostridia bacterium]|nr:hypothetical protein [Clostridia bacterium]